MDINVGRGIVAPHWGLHWWAVVIRGIIAILFGILALAWPGVTLGILLMLFGIFAFADGIAAIIAAIGTAEGRKRWFLLLLVGLVGIAAGIVTFSYPGMTTLSLLYIIAIWAIVVGVLHIVAAIAAPGEITPRWLWGLSGIFSVLFGILLFAQPLAGILAVVWLIGFYALIFGFTEIILGLHLRGFGQQMRSALQH